MRKPIGVISLTLLLSACRVVQGNQISAMNTQQVQTLSDRQVCNHFASSATLTAERQRRGLADCSDAALQCKSMGYAPGTALYLQCRTMIATADAANAATAAAVVANATAPPPPPLAPLPSLPPLQRPINCTTMSVGPTAQTTCN
jgi:hypothetical protein